MHRKAAKRRFATWIVLVLVCCMLRQAAAQEAVEAKLPAGVRAVWSLGSAYREASPTRERLCINGLWRL